jgi:hypothetical protein
MIMYRCTECGSLGRTDTWCPDHPYASLQAEDVPNYAIPKTATLLEAALQQCVPVEFLPMSHLVPQDLSPITPVQYPNRRKS